MGINSQIPLTMISKGHKEISETYDENGKTMFRKLEFVQMLSIVAKILQTHNSALNVCVHETQ
jgi:hypothetical protein